MQETNEVSVKGKKLRLKAISVNGQSVIIQGKFLTIGRIMDEWYNDIINPESVIEYSKKVPHKPDLFTFFERPPSEQPLYPYYYEWDNVAAIPITTYAEWLKTIDKRARRAIKKSEERGLRTKITDFNDELVKGISGIYNEVPLRQGSPFWHYGKPLERVKEENSTYIDRATFIGIYDGDELVGFTKLVYTGKTARTMQIISKISHRDKAPNNALIAKAVEVCIQNSITYLVYGKMEYGKTDSSGIREFKRKNGFLKIEYPRYYIPLTFKGKIALALKLHGGIGRLIPKKILTRLKSVRNTYFKVKYRLPR